MTPEEKLRLLKLRQMQAQAGPPGGVQQPPAPAPTAQAQTLDERISGFLRPINQVMGGVIDKQVESATLGMVGDEARAAVGSMASPQTYGEALQGERAREAQFEKEYPKTALAAELSGAFAPGVGGLKVVDKLARGSRAGAGAITGALAGGTYAAMEGEGLQDRVTDGAIGAVAGGFLGGATPRILDGFASLPRAVKRTFIRADKRPTQQALKAAKNAAYKAVDNSGEVFSPSEMKALSQRVGQIFNDGTYVEETDAASRAVLKILDARSTQPTKLSQLDSIRQNLWKRYGSAKDQPRILDAIREIDALIESKAGSSELMSAARLANSRYAKAQLLTDAFQKADDQTAATGSGGNVLNKYRQAVSSIINNERKAKFFSQDEIDLMRQFVRGGIKENTLRRIGKLSPEGNGLMLMLHAVGGVTSAGATVPFAVVGAGAKRAADRGVERAADHLIDVASGFRPAVQPQARLNALSAGAISAQAPAIENGIQHIPKGWLPQ